MAHGLVDGQHPPSCRSAELQESDWQRLEAQHGPAVRALAGTFAMQSGPNCFATAVGALSRSLPQAISTANLWLTQGAFERRAAEAGLTRAEFTPDAPAGSLMVWANDDGLPQHACFMLGDGLVLNKDSQSWWSPRQIVTVEHMLSNWADAGFTVSLRRA